MINLFGNYFRYYCALICLSVVFTVNANTSDISYIDFGVITHGNICVRFVDDEDNKCHEWPESFGQFVRVTEQPDKRTVIVGLDQYNVVFKGKKENYSASPFNKKLYKRIFNKDYATRISKKQIDENQDIIDETSNVVVAVSFDREYFFNAQDSGLKQSELGSSEYVQVLKNEHHIFRKALITTNTTGNNISEQVKYYSRPTLAESYFIDQVNLFNIFHILKFKYPTDDNGIEQPDKEPIAALLVRDEHLADLNARDAMLGWVAIDSFREWDTRIGAEFNKSNFSARQECGPGKLYVSADGVGGNEYDEESTRSEYLEYYVNRYPVIEHQEGNIDKIIHIGGTSPDQNVRTANAKQVMVQNISPDAEILILIDATKGMEQHITAVKKGVLAFLSDISNKQTLKPSIGIATYRDYPDGKDLFVLQQQFTDQYQLLERAIDSIDVTSAKGDRKGAWAIPEALFQGIDKSIDQVNWNINNKTNKYLLVIGDYGNHTEHDLYETELDLPAYDLIPKAVKKALVNDRKYQMPKLADKLRGNGIEIFGLQVNVEGKFKLERIFAEQLQELIASSSAAVIDKEQNRIEGSFVKVSDDSASHIAKGLNQFMQYKFREQETLKRIVNGLSVYDTRYKTAILQRLGIDVADTVQVTTIRYVKDKVRCNNTEYKQLVYRVLIDRVTLETLKTELIKLLKKMKFWDPRNYRNFERTLKELVKALTDDDIGPNEKIAEFLEKRLGLPIETPLLQGNISDATNYMNGLTRPQRLELIKKLDLKANQLEKVLIEQVLEILRWDKKKKRHVAKDDTERQKYFYNLSLPLPDPCNINDEKCIEINKSRRGHEKDNIERTHAWVPFEYFP